MSADLNNIDDLWIYLENGKLVSVHREQHQCPDPDDDPEVREIQHWLWRESTKAYVDTDCRGC